MDDMVTGQYSRVNERCQIRGGGAFALKSRAKQIKGGLGRLYAYGGAYSRA